MPQATNIEPKDHDCIATSYPHVNDRVCILGIHVPTSCQLRLVSTTLLFFSGGRISVSVPLPALWRSILSPLFQRMASFIPHHLHLPNLRLFDGHRAFHSTARDGVGCHTFAVAILGGGTKPPHHPGCFNVTRAGLQLGPHTVGAGHILPNSPATLFHSALCSCILGMCGSSPAIRSTAFRLCSIAAGLR